MSDEQKPASEPLYDIKALVATVDDWAKRHHIKRLAADEVGIALEKTCDRYELERQQLYARIAELEAKLIAVSRELASTDNADRYYRGFNAGYELAETRAASNRRPDEHTDTQAPDNGDSGID